MISEVLNNTFLIILSHVNTLVFTFAFIYLFTNMQRVERDTLADSYNLGNLVWLGHCAVFFIVTSVLRIFFDYHGPSDIISIWGGALFLHGAFAIIGVVYIRNKY